VPHGAGRRDIAHRREPKLEVRSLPPHFDVSKLQVGGPKHQIVSLKLEGDVPKPEIDDRKLQVDDPKRAGVWLLQ